MSYTVEINLKLSGEIPEPRLSTPRTAWIVSYNAGSAVRSKSGILKMFKRDLLLR
jgi:hypothetical protein